MTDPASARAADFMARLHPLPHAWCWAPSARRRHLFSLARIEHREDMATAATAERDAGRYGLADELPRLKSLCGLLDNRHSWLGTLHVWNVPDDLPQCKTCARVQQRILDHLDAREPCRCDPPGSGEEYCNGACGVDWTG